MLMVNSKYGNQMFLQMTSNSSTRAFNEITSCYEHWERKVSNGFSGLFEFLIACRENIR